MKKLEKNVSKKLPSWKLLTAGLSIKVTGIDGPITEGELSQVHGVWEENSGAT